MKPVQPVTFENSLTNFASIAVEFNAKRNQITPDQINSNSKSARKYWWKCTNNHEWEASVAIRIDHNNKCPYCAGRLATPENNLLTLHPEIAVLFNETKNGKNASEVTPTFGGKVQWICANGHEFNKSVRETVRTKGLCRECNSLAYKFPELCEQYHPDNTIPFESLSYGSNKKVQWQCDQGHEYEQTVIHKGVNGRGCPYCAGRYATTERNLLKIYPDIASQFDSEKSETTADKVTPSSNLDMWWKCPEGHSYKATPNKRTRKDSPYGCPDCSTRVRISGESK